MSRNHFHRGNEAHTQARSTKQQDLTLVKSRVQKPVIETPESISLEEFELAEMSSQDITTLGRSADMTIPDGSQNLYYLPRNHGDDIERQASNTPNDRGSAVERQSSDAVMSNASTSLPNDVPAKSDRYAEYVCNRVQHLMYVAPKFDGAPDPNYRVSVEICKLYNDILNFTQQTNADADALKPLDKYAKLAAKSMNRLIPLAEIGIQCHKEIQAVFDFYKKNGNSAMATPEDYSRIRQRAEHVGMTLIPSLKEVIQDLLEDLEKCQKSIPAQEEDLISTIAKWTKTKGATVLTAFIMVTANVIALIPHENGATAVGLYIVSAVKAVLDATEKVVALRSGSSASEFEKLTKKLTEHTDHLIRHCRIFLGTLEELHSPLLLLGKAGGAHWDSRLEGAVGAYLFGFELDSGKFMELLNMDAHADILIHNAAALEG